MAIPSTRTRPRWAVQGLGFMGCSSRRSSRIACWRCEDELGRWLPARRNRAAATSGLRGLGVLTVIFIGSAPGGRPKAPRPGACDATRAVDGELVGSARYGSRRRQRRFGVSKNTVHGRSVAAGHQGGHRDGKSGHGVGWVDGWASPRRRASTATCANDKRFIILRKRACSFKLGALCAPAPFATWASALALQGRHRGTRLRPQRLVGRCC